jgi:prepilin-type N-terminal cleavage/methylation domain-containing protein
MTGSKTRGLSLVEILIVLAILGIFLTLGFTLRSPSARVYANDLRGMIQQGKFEAIKRNRAVAIVWNATDQQFEMKVINDDGSFANPSCSSTDVILVRIKALNEYQGLSLTTNMAGSGLIWTPAGLARPCTGSVLASTTTVTQGSTNINVLVSNAGAVTIQ